MNPMHYDETNTANGMGTRAGTGYGEPYGDSDTSGTGCGERTGGGHAARFGGETRSPAPDGMGHDHGDGNEGMRYGPQWQ